MKANNIRTALLGALAVRTIVASVPIGTFNPATKGSAVTLSNGNLTAATSGSVGSAMSTTARSSGKYYFEGSFDVAGGFSIGLCRQSTYSGSSSVGNTTDSVGIAVGGAMYLNGSSIGNWNTGVGSNGTAIGVAVDLTNNLIWARQILPTLGTWNDSGTPNPATGVGGYSIAALSGSGALLVCVGPYSGMPTGQATLNFSASPFTYSPPAGFSAWG